MFLCFLLFHKRILAIVLYLNHFVDGFHGGIAEPQRGQPEHAEVMLVAVLETADIILHRNQQELALVLLLAGKLRLVYLALFLQGPQITAGRER